MLWTESKCRKFSIKSLYKALEPSSTISFPSNIVWKSCVQPKVSFFGWEATWGKTLTLDQIQKRGWLLGNRCYLCQMHEESINYILLHCAKTRTLWELFSLFLGCSGCCLCQLGQLFWVGMGPLWVRRGWKFREQVPYAFFGRFGRQGTKLCLKMKCCPSKILKVLLFVFFGRR